MALPTTFTPAYRVLTAQSAATISAGFTVATPSPVRGTIVAIWLGPIDGSAITGAAALLSLTIAGIASASMSCAPVAAGTASGGHEILGPRANVNEGELIKLVLPGATLTSAQNAVLSIVVRLL